jgi:excisionase family DNA binding protein
MTNTDINIITPEEAAKLLQVTTRTIYRWLEDGDLVGAKFGDTWRVNKDSIINKINGNHKETTKE